MALHVASVDRCSSDDLFMSNGGRLLSDSDSSEHKFREQASVSGGARKGAKQFQEDSYFHWISASQAVIVAAVFDGHGGYTGAVASATARAHTLQFFESYEVECERWTPDEWAMQLHRIFASIHEAIRTKFISDGGNKRYIDERGIVRASNGDPVHGGTTGSISVLLRPSKGQHVLITANVGDSTALLVTANNNSSWQFLTVDHGPENADEFARVQGLSTQTHPQKLMYVYDKQSVLRKYDCPLVFRKDGSKDPAFVQNPWGNGLHPTNVRYEPAVYAVTPKSVSRDTTCIAMTRALGDFYAHQFGLTFEPSVTIIYPPMDCSYHVVVASDGIWDCWRYEDLAQYLVALDREQSSTDSLVETLLNESIRRAISNFGDSQYDDASLVCIRLVR